MVRFGVRIKPIIIKQKCGNIFKTISCSAFPFLTCSPFKLLHKSSKDSIVFNL